MRKSEMPVNNWMSKSAQQALADDRSLMRVGFVNVGLDFYI